MKSVEQRALDLLEHLRVTGGATTVECMQRLGCSKSQFQAALDFARNEIGPVFGLAVPHPVPDDGFRYHLTGEWISSDGTPAIEAGTRYAIERIEARLHSVLRDVQIARANVPERSLTGHKVKYLEKHLNRILGTLADIETQNIDALRKAAEQVVA